MDDGDGGEGCSEKVESSAKFGGGGGSSFGGDCSG